jgi:serine protease Do
MTGEPNEFHLARGGGMQNIVIRHLSGTKANQVEKVSLQGFREVLIGREANTQIQFDADREDLVSRNHARISRDPADPTGFLLTDLNSRNGTFINRRRIYGSSILQHGDHVQLGPSGPEFAFEVDPPPAARPTRLEEPSRPAPPTREAVAAGTASAAVLGGSGMPPGMAVPGTEAPRPVGRQTVERLVGEVATQMKGESRRTMWTAVIGILTLLVAGAAYYEVEQRQKKLEQANMESRLAALANQNQQVQEQQTAALAAIKANSNSRSPEAQKQVTELQAMVQHYQDILAKNRDEMAKINETITPNGAGSSADAPPAAAASAASAHLSLPDLTPEQIHAANVRSVIYIENYWKVIDAGTGGQIYLYHHRNNLGACKDVPESAYLPMFIEDGGRLYPVLSTLPNEGHNVPIVGGVGGSGFIVGGEGFFLSNRHVLAPWESRMGTGEFTDQKVGIQVKGSSVVGCINRFPSWVPSEGSPVVVDKIDATPSDRLQYSSLGTKVEGEAQINVTFAKTAQPYRATTVTVSERQDIALGKVDVPGGGKPVTLFADSDAIRPGQPVVVMGYPGITPNSYGAQASRDMLDFNKTHLQRIADPTLTTGPISNVTPSGLRGVDAIMTQGEAYQLGINTTGHGNSGGPVFDSKGRVIAVFSAGTSTEGFLQNGALASWAVPIKYGIELIDNPSIIR